MGQSIQIGQVLEQVFRRDPPSREAPSCPRAPRSPRDGDTGSTTSRCPDAPAMIASFVARTIALHVGARPRRLFAFERGADCLFDRADRERQRCGRSSLWSGVRRGCRVCGRRMLSQEAQDGRTCAGAARRKRPRRTRRVLLDALQRRFGVPHPPHEWSMRGTRNVQETRGLKIGVASVGRSRSLLEPFHR